MQPAEKIGSPRSLCCCKRFKDQGSKFFVILRITEILKDVFSKKEIGGDPL
jgi:hypothetical protein